MRRTRVCWSVVAAIVAAAPLVAGSAANQRYDYEKDVVEALGK